MGLFFDRNLQGKQGTHSVHLFVEKFLLYLADNTIFFHKFLINVVITKHLLATSVFSQAYV